MVTAVLFAAPPPRLLCGRCGSSSSGFVAHDVLNLRKPLLTAASAPLQAACTKLATSADERCAFEQIKHIFMQVLKLQCQARKTLEQALNNTV